MTSIDACLDTSEINLALSRFHFLCFFVSRGLTLYIRSFLLGDSLVDIDQVLLNYCPPSETKNLKRDKIKMVLYFYWAASMGWCKLSFPKWNKVYLHILYLFPCSLRMWCTCLSLQIPSKMKRFNKNCRWWPLDINSRTNKLLMCIS